MLRSFDPVRPTGLRPRRAHAARTSFFGSLAVSMLAVLAMASVAAGADAGATDAPAGPAAWDYRTVFVVWDEAASDWRADWNDGSSTAGLEAVLDNEGSEGWELDSIAHEQYDLIVGPDSTSQEARRLRLIFRRPLAATEEEASVSIQGFAFVPDSVEVTAGTSVTWTNGDPVEHTVTAGDASFDSGSMSPTATFSHTFDAVGTFTYGCAIHPGMTGTVIVR
jgi:plastocyanin